MTTAAHPFSLIPAMAALKAGTSDLCDEQALTQVIGPWAASMTGATSGDAQTFAAALAGFVADERRAGMITDDQALTLVASAAEMYEEDPAAAAGLLAEALAQERSMQP